MKVVVTESPFPVDYTDGNDPPPWTYSGATFKAWVWEVLLDMGKAGRYPKTVTEAIEVAEGARYKFTVTL